MNLRPVSAALDQTEPMRDELDLWVTNGTALGPLRVERDQTGAMRSELGPARIYEWRSWLKIGYMSHTKYQAAILDL